MYLTTYSQYLTWSEYLLRIHGVTSEDELFNHMAKDKLLERYNLI